MDEEKQALRLQMWQRYHLKTLCLGWQKVTHRAGYGLAFVLLLLGWAAALWKLCAVPLQRLPGVAVLALPLTLLLTGAAAVTVAYLFGIVPGGRRVYDDLTRTGFVNFAGEAPVLIGQHQKGEVRVLTFEAVGFPRSMWEDSQAELESALNGYIASIQEGGDRRTITLVVVPPGTALGSNILWDDRLINWQDDGDLLLGQGLLGEVRIQLDRMPHILIGGSTGSGKSVLLKVVLWQGIKHRNRVFIADFKGGVDFSSGWHQLADIITEEDALVQALGGIVAELEQRKALFVAEGARNLQEYRAKQPASVDPMPRIFFACDEVAELLDKTGADKARKEQLATIEGAISTIARQGRAFGIHLVLATQRPDANILSGQIKNNLDVRVCGKADTTLSTIIIGDGRAHTQIPKDAQGRFILQDGTVFQGFNLPH